MIDSKPECCKTKATCCADTCCKPEDHCCKDAVRKPCAKPCVEDHGKHPKG